MTNLSKLVIATRQSQLALTQANLVKASLQQIFPTLEVELLDLQTEGDKNLKQSLVDVGGKGLFIKELEVALLAGKAHLAVHSLKDLPATLSPDFEIAAILERADPRDVFVSKHYPNWQSLPLNAIVGTSSLRRQSQLLSLRSDLEIHSLRGNVDTRLRKLDIGEYDAIVLAAAGLHRLSLGHRIKQYFSVEELLPCAGQGALVLEIRGDNAELRVLLAQLHHQTTSDCIEAERAVSRFLGCDCKTSLGSYACFSEGELHLRALLSSPHGKKRLFAEKKAQGAEPVEVGEAIAKQLVAMGATQILQDCFPS